MICVPYTDHRTREVRRAEMFESASLRLSSLYEAGQFAMESTEALWYARLAYWDAAARLRERRAA